MNYQTYEINELEEFLSIKDEWNQLLSKSDCDQPFLRHEWLTVWWDHFGGDKVLAIILVKREGTLVLAMPLMEVRNRWLGLIT